jgi:hypothetical protein
MLALTGRGERTRAGGPVEREVRRVHDLGRRYCTVSVAPCPLGGLCTTASPGRIVSFITWQQRWHPVIVARVPTDDGVKLTGFDRDGRLAGSGRAREYALEGRLEVRSARKHVHPRPFRPGPAGAHLLANPSSFNASRTS